MLQFEEARVLRNLTNLFYVAFSSVKPSSTVYQVCGLMCRESVSRSHSVPISGSSQDLDPQRGPSKQIDLRTFAQHPQHGVSRIPMIIMIDPVGFFSGDSTARGTRNTIHHTATITPRFRT